MKQTVNFSQFVDAFRFRKNNFTFEGKRALFDYMEEYEKATGEEIELDIIALCCEFTEYESLEEIQNDYPDIKSIEDLEDRTTVIMVDSNWTQFIIAQF